MFACGQTYWTYSFDAKDFSCGHYLAEVAMTPHVEDCIGSLNDFAPANLSTDPIQT